MLGIVLGQGGRVAHGLFQTMRHDFHAHLYGVGFRVGKRLGQQRQLADLIRAHAPIDAMLAVLLDGHGFIGRIQQLRAVEIERNLCRFIALQEVMHHA